jgi:hypothetical protein
VKFKEQPRSDERDEPVERDDVHVAANRCPFCHEDVEAAESVVCRECLARHHSSCWSESEQCSACACTVKLQPEPQRRPQWVVGVTLGVFFAGVIASLMLMNHEGFHLTHALVLSLTGVAVALWGQLEPGSMRAWLKPTGIK